ncbi:MAG: 50S ribosomal protein L17 [Phaeodactylibacter sp.]|nr:50S ribosomal protein L17 [Phaeodactylibacter sp.]
MRHGKKFNHLGRKAGHRKALLRNLAIALIEHKRINTTLAKAKALRTFIEPLVTKSKEDTTHSRRVVFSYLQNKEAVKELFSTVAGKVGDRPGGYVRVIKTGFRKGDAAETAMIEFVDFNPSYNGASTNTAGSNASGRRRRRRGSNTTAAATTTAVATTAAAASEEE